MNYLNNGGAFLVESILGLYILFLLIRFWMHWTNADFRNPIGHFFVQISNPIILPFRNLISTNRGFGFATLIVAIVLMFVKMYILLILNKTSPAIAGVVVLAMAEIIKTSVYIFLGAMIIRIISSWIMPQGSYNPVLNIINSLTEPLMAPARRIIPAISGIDLSPILVFIFLNLSLKIIVDPIFGLAYSLL
jgi:YggT family protein